MKNLAALLPVLLLLVSPFAFGDERGEEEGFKKIFDGESLKGWDGKDGFWRVEDGAITGQTTPGNPTSGNTFIVWEGGELDDFDLRLKYRIVGGNSGIQYRSWRHRDDPYVVGGYQADLEAGDTYSGILYEERGRGILAQRGQKTMVGPDHKPRLVENVGDSAEIQSKIKKEDWNDYRVVARGNTFTHYINGVRTVEVTDADPEQFRRKGVLALQLHAGPPMKAQFRDIRLKRLPLEKEKKVVFLAGRRSHGYGAHEHKAGSMLLANALNEAEEARVLATVQTDGWPDDPSALDNADAIVIYCDGGGGHMANHNLGPLGELMDKGVGLACLHYAVEVPKGKSGDAFVAWLGGYFETHWSVNPHWTAEFKELPDHPVTRGVEPFSINDEWYFHMRFRDGMEGVTPILSAVAPESTMRRGDGAHSGNPHVRESVKRGDKQHVAWVVERDDGGRGFGFTGGHNHINWAQDDFRTLVLNAIVWISGAEVPKGGVPSETPTLEEMEANQDFPKGNREMRPSFDYKYLPKE